jgi:uncharacterized protein UPF0547
VRDQVRIQRSLEQAREALAGGNLKRALKHAWEAGLPASSRNDAATLQEVIELGAEIRDHASGREAVEAAKLVTFCTEALEHPRLRRGVWAGFRTESPLREDTKTCPDCAETIKAAAKVCRFCGYRFEV